MVSDTTLRLTGNTEGITDTVDLWRGDTNVSVKVDKNPQTQALTVDLSQQTSGEYQVSRLNSHEKTPVFTVYSDKAPLTPLAREIPASLQLKTSKTQVELIWHVPEAYLTHKVTFTCEYVDEAGQTHSETFTDIDPTQLGSRETGHYSHLTTYDKRSEKSIIGITIKRPHIDSTLPSGFTHSHRCKRARRHPSNDIFCTLRHHLCDVLAKTKSTAYLPLPG